MSDLKSLTNELLEDADFRGEYEKIQSELNNTRTIMDNEITKQDRRKKGGKEVMGEIIRTHAVDLTAPVHYVRSIVCGRINRIQNHNLYHEISIKTNVS